MYGDVVGIGTIDGAVTPGTGLATTAAIAATEPKQNHLRESSMPITVSYATTDEEAVAIHHFLCRVAGPLLPGPIDAEKSINEVWRVVHNEVAITAWSEDGELVGTLGLTRATHWWSDIGYFCNRWCFAIPGSRAWRPMLNEARIVARELGVECMIASEERGRLTILNRSKTRARKST